VGSPPRGRLHEAIEYFLWAYTPFRPMTAPDFYELVSINAFTERGLYLNLGYWKTALTIHRPARPCRNKSLGRRRWALTTKSSTSVLASPPRTLYGCKRFAPRRITGLNVTPSQVRIACERIRRLDMAGRIDLLEGSATDMPLPDASCDVITAVECAFHFQTRQHRCSRQGLYSERSMPTG
jgi:hypothetical protein